MTALTTRYDEALLYAADLHRTQVRKGTTIPYLSHLMGVSGLVLEAGGDEDQAIAGLLHDAIEDQGEHTSHVELTRRFGAQVADIVLACSHSEFEGDEPDDLLARWWWRRERYLKHLADAPIEVLVVSRADKLHNLRTILMDMEQEGFWSRFRTGYEGQYWYYDSLATTFGRRIPGPQSDALREGVARLKSAQESH